MRWPTYTHFFHAKIIAEHVAFLVLQLLFLPKGNGNFDRKSSFSPSDRKSRNALDKSRNFSVTTTDIFLV